MKRSTERILTTHAGRLPILTISLRSSKLAPTATTTFDRLVKAGVARQCASRWSSATTSTAASFERGEHYYNSRVTNVAIQPLQAGEGPSILVHQQERHMPEFRGSMKSMTRLATSGQASSTHSRRTRR